MATLMADHDNYLYICSDNEVKEFEWCDDCRNNHEIIDYYDETDFDSITSIIERLCEFEKYPEYYFSLFCEYNTYKNELVEDLEMKLNKYFEDYA